MINDENVFYNIRMKDLHGPGHKIELNTDSIKTQL